VSDSPRPLPSGDEAARRRALDPALSVLVQAPAGSGKTELLIQRFLALLARVAAPESVVAITFTRKAAAEMQERILGTLRRAAAGDVPEKPHERISYELALGALAEDRRMGWNLLEHPARLRIQTIDSLCSSIARQMPWLARFGAPPAVREDARPLYQEAARRAVAAVEDEGPFRDALEGVLLHLDNNAASVCGLIERMLQIRDQWLPLVVDGEARREDLERAMENAIIDGLERASALVPREIRATIVELAAYAASNLPPENRLAACAGLADWPRPEPGAMACWLAFTDLLLTGKDEWRKSIDKRQGFPVKTPERKRQLYALIAALSGNEALRDALVLIRALPPARYSEAQWQVMRSLFATLKLAAGHLKMVFRETGEVDFCEVAEGARNALGESGAPSDLALGLDARIEHLLVDEFQDTSVAQFELLEKLTAGWQPGDGHTLFLVGDPMQSIYRFRQAEVGLFLKTARGTVGEVSPSFLRLTVNYRSVAGIVERVNGIFGRIFPARNDIATGAISYSPSEPAAVSGAGEAVQMHAFRKGEDAAEARRVVDLVRQARGSSVAVLVRARTHLPEIVAALKREGMAFRAIDIDRLGERTVVRDLLALTRAMLHLADRPSWLAILRAPWCGLTLADLDALVAGQPAAAVWGLLAGNLGALSSEGQARAARLRDVLAAAFAERGRWSLRRWVERTWYAVGGPACLSSDGHLQDAFDYFDLLERHEKAGDLPDFDGFRAAVDELYAQPDSSADGGLQLMTIHKAKGLQFDTVIVPGLGRRARPDMPALLLWAERPREARGVDRLLATIKETGAGQDPVYAYLRVLDRQKSAHESVRLLYVASTRARRHLHLLGHAVQDAGGDVHPESGSLLACLWPGLPDQERQLFLDAHAGSPPAAEQAAASPGVPLKRLPRAWCMPPLPAPAAWQGAALDIAPGDRPSYLWVGDTLRHVGTVVHEVLQRIAAEGLDRFDRAVVRSRRAAWRSALANLGVAPAELDTAARRLEEAVLGTLASERGRWILASHAEAASECSLTGEWGRGTVDRTFVDRDGTRWVIDYKTSAHEGSGREHFLDEEQRRYRGQLERYARLLAPLGRPVRLGLYFPLLDAWREWSPDA
jgi:ATP-dependent exoDNAse (exonuclease V) beta subunit